MANAFKIFGLLIVLFGFLDMGLLMHRISIYRVFGVDLPSLIGPFSYMFAIGYGALTIFVAQYLKTPPRKDLEVIDLSDPFIGGETRYAAVEKPAPAFKVELADIALAFLWGSVVVLLYMILFVRVAPNAEALLFAPDLVTPKTRKILVAVSVLCVVLPLFYGIFVMRLREGLSLTAMLCGAVMSGVLLSVGAISNAKIGYGLFGGAFMHQTYAALGHPNGLPEGWSVEQELIARLQTAGQIKRPRHRLRN